MLGLKNLILRLAKNSGIEAEVLWPWEFIDSHELLALGDQAGRKIFQACLSNLQDADMLIALLDGPQVDDGTAWEIGFFYRNRQGDRQPLIGIRTDIRNSGETPGAKTNAMIEHACDHIATNIQEVMDYLKLFFVSPHPPG